jgi:hypothetical protein
MTTPPTPTPPDTSEAHATAASRTLDIGGLEAVYDRLAHAIDEAGPEHSECFLVKLALLNAQALGDPVLFVRHVEAALRDL